MAAYSDSYTRTPAVTEFRIGQPEPRYCLYHPRNECLAYSWIARPSMRRSWIIAWADDSKKASTISVLSSRSRSGRAQLLQSGR